MAHAEGRRARCCISVTFRDHLPCERLILEVHREAAHLPHATAVNAMILKDEQRGVIVVLRVHEGGRSRQAVSRSWDSGTALRDAFAQLKADSPMAPKSTRRHVVPQRHRSVEIDRRV